MTAGPRSELAPTGRSAVNEATPTGPDDLVVQPQRLLRVMWMAQPLLAELHALPDMEPPARRRFRALGRRMLIELGSSLSPPLAEELRRLVELPPDEPTYDELRVLHAQLVGWLNGLLAAMRLMALMPDWRLPVDLARRETNAAGG